MEKRKRIRKTIRMVLKEARRERQQNEKLHQAKTIILTRKLND